MKSGFNSLTHPGTGTTKNLNVAETLKVYYTTAIIPFILFLVVGYIWYAFYGTGVNCYSGYLHSTSIGCGPSQYFSVLGHFISYTAYYIGAPVAVFLAGVLFLLIVPPIGIFIKSIIYHIVGKSFLKEFKKDWSKTFTAVTYGALPLLVLSWMLFIPLVSYIVLALVVVWGFLNSVIALANQQKITRLQSFGVYLVALFIVLLIAVVASGLAIVGLAAPIYSPVLP